MSEPETRRELERELSRTIRDAYLAGHLSPVEIVEAVTAVAENEQAIFALKHGDPLRN